MEHTRYRFGDNVLKAEPCYALDEKGGFTTLETYLNAERNPTRVCAYLWHWNNALANVFA